MIAEDHFAPGEAAKHPFAITYQGEYETPWDGTATAVRLHARALAQAGLPVLIRSISSLVTDEYGQVYPVHHAGLPPEVRKEVGHLLDTSASGFFPRILHAVVRDAEHLRRLILPRGAIASGGFEEEMRLRKHIYESTIVYSVWERSPIDPAIVRELSRVAECWVPSEYNRQILILSGVPKEKIVVVPHPFDPDSPILRLRSRRPPSGKRFYSIGRWEPRKGYAELIEAFLGAFQPGDEASLVIKYIGGEWPDYPTPDEATASALRRSAHRGWTPENFPLSVKLIGRRLPRAEILRLHYQNNCYVAPSAGEAWCLPAFEAALAGNRLVSTPTGVSDFADVDDVIIDTTATPVPKSYHWEADAKWDRASVLQIEEALRSATPPLDYQSRSPLDRFSIEAVGAEMRERVVALADRVLPQASEYWRSR
jgi:glycosyltransferase involved in cell wall biosynthesis